MGNWKKKKGHSKKISTFKYQKKSEKFKLVHFKKILTLFCKEYSLHAHVRSKDLEGRRR